MKSTYRGSLHCGAVRFECDLDLAQGTSKCNCSICAKARFWKAIVTADAFRLLEGEDALSLYQFGSNNIRHFFCRNCGVKAFGRGHLDELGDFYAVNVACGATDRPEATDRRQLFSGVGNTDPRSRRVGWPGKREFWTRWDSKRSAALG